MLDVEDSLTICCIIVTPFYMYLVSTEHESLYFDYHLVTGKATR